MPFWPDNYPHKIYASVLLLDGKIESWKVGQSAWRGIGSITAYWKMDRINDYEVKSACWLVYNSKQHNQIFSTDSANWFKQWPVADDFYGAKPYYTEKGD